MIFLATFFPMASEEGMVDEDAEVPFVFLTVSSC